MGEKFNKGYNGYNLYKEYNRKCNEIKIRMAGHIGRDWTTEVIDWYPRECKKVLKRPQRRWVDEIRKMCSMKRISFPKQCWRGILSGSGCWIAVSDVNDILTFKRTSMIDGYKNVLLFKKLKFNLKI